MKNSKLYNVIFPLWFVFFMPPVVFITLLGNLLIDGAIIYIVLRTKQTGITLKSIKGLIIKVWILGFVADIIGAAIIFALNNFLKLDDYHIWTDPLTIVVFLFTVFLVGGIIFLFNYWLCKKERFPHEVCFRVGLAMGIITAPWMFLIPTPWVG